MLSFLPGLRKQVVRQVDQWSSLPMSPTWKNPSIPSLQLPQRVLLPQDARHYERDVTPRLRIQHSPARCLANDRERSTSATLFPVPNTILADVNSNKILNLRLQHFCGRDLNNIRAWLHMVNQQLIVYDIPEHKRVPLAAQALCGDAFTFYYYFVSCNNYIDSTWKVF